MNCYVYIMTNPHNTVLYTGVTSDLENRVFEHKVMLHPGFTSKYNCIELIYYEEFNDINIAIGQEKQLKRYKRKWKENLINEMNPAWKDLSEGWYDPREFTSFLK